MIRRYPNCSMCSEDLIPDDGELCGACAKAVSATAKEMIAAAEERGRRSAETERDELREALKSAAVALNVAIGWLTGLGSLTEAERMRGWHQKAMNALAPRVPRASEGPPCAGCGHPKWQHQYSSKEHAFCSQPLDELQRDYCRCKNYLAPRDSGSQHKDWCALFGNPEAGKSCDCAPRDSGKEG